MAKPQQHHIHALTGIRFVAALGVFVQHMLGRLGIATFAWPFGDGGVTFFFVLSGFILTYVYSDRLTSYRDLPRFYFTRWARIWPLHMVTLSLWVFFFFKLTYIFKFADPYHKLILNALLLQSWVPSYSWSFAYNGVSWSISTEAFFYLMFPLLVLKRGWFWSKYLGLTIAIAVFILTVNAYTDAINQTGWASVDPLIHCFPLVRLFEFMTGMAVGYLFLARPNLKTSKRNFCKDTLIEFIAIGLLLAYYRWQYHGPRTVELSQVFSVTLVKIGPVFFYAILIFLFSHTRGIVGRLMGSRVMVYLGEISFAFYMIHFLIVNVMSGYHFAPIPQYYGGLILAALTFSLASASLLYHFVEIPAKASLLALYDHGILAGIGKTFTGIKAALLSPPVWAALVAIGLNLWLLPSWSLEHVEDREIVQNIRKTQLFHQPIHFDRDAVLFGLTSRESGDVIELKLTWIKKRNYGRRRLLEIYSANDQLLHHFKKKHRRYLDAPIGEVFVETFYIAKDKFVEGSRLCVGFYGKQEKMAKVSGGPRSFYNRRLDIYSPDEAD
ncbi:acyltransferase [bacterium]|nr:acyltransferase [bacterium]